MINLLSTESKRDLRAARLNVVLATYSAVIGAALVCVVLLVLFSNWWLTNKINIADAQKAKNEAGTSAYASVRNEAAEFKSNLSQIQSVLTNRSHYSTALLNIAGSLPSGLYIGAASLSPTFTTTPLKITGLTANYNAALALKDKLSSSKLYTAVSLDNVNCDDTTASGCTVSLTATINPATIYVEAAQ